MFRPQSILIFALTLGSLPLSAQAPGPLQSLVGKEVVLKIDMPGTQQGVDLRFNKDDPMNWKEYSNRLKSNGTAIHKGDTARVTAIVVKNDRIEFQLDGGGFGTFWDDSNTTVTPTPHATAFDSSGPATSGTGFPSASRSRPATCAVMTTCSAADGTVKMKRTPVSAPSSP